MSIFNQFSKILYQFNKEFGQNPQALVIGSDAEKQIIQGLSEIMPIVFDPNPQRKKSLMGIPLEKWLPMHGRRVEPTRPPYNTICLLYQNLVAKAYSITDGKMLELSQHAVNHLNDYAHFYVFDGKNMNMKVMA